MGPRRSRSAANSWRVFPFIARPSGAETRHFTKGGRIDILPLVDCFAGTF